MDAMQQHVTRGAGRPGRTRSVTVAFACVMCDDVAGCWDLRLVCSLTIGVCIHDMCHKRAMISSQLVKVHTQVLDVSAVLGGWDLE